jgi:fatty acid CoA ligase FadD9
MSAAIIPYQMSNDSIAQRIERLKAEDASFRAALPDPEVTAARGQAELGLAQIVQVVMEGYADRAALATRASELVTDAAGRTSRRLLPNFETMSYRELWARARALASLWYHDAVRSLRADDRLCILAFAGTDFVTVDLAAIHNGAVVVPLQTNAPLAQLQAIFGEVQPNWLATNVESLPTAVELALTAWQPRGLLLFGHHPEVDEERERVEAAQARLAAAGLPRLLQTLPSACAEGERLGPAPPFVRPDTDLRMCTIYYTSGSTGLPKGAMYPERMVKPNWRAVASLPVFYLHYMPMNHSFGRSGVFLTLGAGGTCYFTGKSDLSTLFDDLRAVRPTFMAMVPRVCEMLFQRFQVELGNRAGGAGDRDTLKESLHLALRHEALGGRLLHCQFGSAPLAPELREFMTACLGYPMDDNYGATEISGAIRNQRISRPPIIDYKLVDVPELGYFTTDKPYPRGELRVKTQSIMLGYYKRPDITAEVFDEEGYYKTGDIMAELEPDRLIYLDRRNNVLKLSQGEFVAIARLEALYANGHALIRQIYLWGTSDRSYLVAVIVPSEEVLALRGIAADAAATKEALREALAAVARAEQLNSYEVPRDFLIEHEPFSTENGLLAGIGKYQRPKFKERYGARLEALYAEIAARESDELAALRRDGRQAPVLETLGRAVQATLGLATIDLTRRCSFAELGGDSLSALSCSLLLEDIYEIEVPAGVINNPTGSLQQLAGFIERAREAATRRPTFASVHGRGAAEIHATDLKLEKFFDGPTLESARRAARQSSLKRTVLVTGANGYLGRFLCLEWLERVAPSDGRVICIARGENAVAARTRVLESFQSGDAALSERLGELAERHLEVLAGDLGEAELGLSFADWQRLAEEVDLIVHPAAFVNHVLPYPQLFAANVVGTAELVRLALSHRLKPIHNVSTVAAAMVPGGGVLAEADDVRKATPVRRLNAERYADGYAHSKWAAEVLLREAADRFGLPVAVFRSDMILAHRRYAGQLNVPDMFTRWLFSIAVTGLAPRSFYAAGAAPPNYDGLPVDFTAGAIAALGACHTEGYVTYHVVNPHDDGISLDTFVDWAIEEGCAIRRIEDYADWYRRFETALRALPERQRAQSSLPLLHQMREPMTPAHGAVVAAPGFREGVRRIGVGPERDIPHLSRELIRKYLADLRLLGLL